jgi:beta-galactosidase
MSRRQFLLNASGSAVAALLTTPLRAADMWSISTEGGDVISPMRLDSDWQFRKGTVGGIEQVWESGDAALWEWVNLPHSFNGYDACDPDKPYFRGQGWYRTRLPLNNPFANGRTILNFQGAGQTSTLWVGSVLVGTHKGGYDEFSFDITEALQRLSLSKTNGGVPVTVCCDNSPDLDRVPSDLSDFCLYGGLYRHVNLLYVPAVSGVNL